MSRVAFSPLDWPSNYSLLRLWHVPKDLHQFVDQLNQQLNHRHMFSRWEINYDKFTSRVLYQLPAHYFPEATLRQHVRIRDFPSRRVRKRPPQDDVVEFKAKCTELRRLATIQEAANPVSFALANSWKDTLKADKHHYLEHLTRRMTGTGRVFRCFTPQRFEAAGCVCPQTRQVHPLPLPSRSLFPLLPH